MQRDRFIASLCTLWLLAAIGCSDDGDKTPTDERGDRDHDSGEGGNEDGPWHEVYEKVIVANGCDSTFCHGAAGMLTLSEEMGYDDLVGVDAKGPDCAGKTTKKRVVAGDPDASLLMEKLTSPKCGTRMPPEPQEAVTAEQLEIVRKWIADGAER